MALLIDSSIFIHFERTAGSLPQAAFSTLGLNEPIAMAAVTASELLVGMHRATRPSQRVRREAFVEGILATVPVVPFDLRVARTHARLAAFLQEKGSAIGSHDLQIAATALTFDYGLLTHNIREFSRIPGLLVKTLDT